MEYQTVPFTFVKQGIFYFARKVPNDLRNHYTSSKISFSLRTRKTAVAKARAIKASQQLDEHWHFLRMQNMDLPGKHMLRMGGHRPVGPAVVTGAQQQDEPGITLSEAVAVYLRLKGANRPVTFHRAAERSCGYVIDVCGDKDITAYTRADANAFRDALIDRQLSGSSITRVFGTVRSIINFAASEIGITLTNPFAGVYYDRKAGVADREPLAGSVPVSGLAGGAGAGSSRIAMFRIGPSKETRRTGSRRRRGQAARRGGREIRPAYVGANV